MQQSNNDIKIGRFLSLVLRHNPSAAGVLLDPNGWADVNELLSGVAKAGKRIDKETLERIVRENSKQRYSFNEDHTKIRANQGHSVGVDVELTPAKPPQYLYHGTADRFIKAIRQEGLKKGSRQHVHLSRDRQTAVSVGRRHGNPVVLVVDAVKMEQEGHVFYRSENGVWLCTAVPANYIIWE